MKSEPWEPLYYQTHLGTPGDVEFYRSALGKPTTVLDLGCGVGRLTQHFIDWGHTVLAVDRSVYGLQTLMMHCKDKALFDSTLCFRSDFLDLPFKRRFSRIVLAFNALLCLTNEEKRRFLNQVSGLLEPSGRFLIDLYEGGAFCKDEETDDWIYEPEFLKTVSVGSESFDVYQSGHLWPSKGLVKMCYDHFQNDADEPDESLRYEVLHHPLSEADLIELCDSAGLVIDQINRTEIGDGLHLFLSLKVR